VLTKIEAAFHRAVVRAHKAGEIDPARNPRALARFLTSSAQGLSVMAKAFPDRTVLEDIVKVTLAALRCRRAVPKSDTRRSRPPASPSRRAYASH